MKPIHKFNKKMKATLIDLLNSDRSWHEDYPNENGTYINKCHLCGEKFVGHVDKVWCRTCYDEIIIDEKTIKTNQP